MGQIYRIFNKINNKSYIGATTKDFEERYIEGRWWAITHNHKLMDDAFVFGSQAFEVSLLEGNLDASRLNERENFFIQHFDSIDPNGYNMINSTSRFLDKNDIQAQKEHTKQEIRKEALDIFYQLVSKGSLGVREAIVLLRKTLEMSQKDFAIKSGMALASLKRFEHRGEASLDMVNKMLAVGGLIAIAGAEDKIVHPNTSKRKRFRSK